MLTRREFTVLGGAAALGASIATNVAAAAPAAARSSLGHIDPMSLVNPEFRPALLELLKQEGGARALTLSSLPKFRKLVDSVHLPVLPEPKVTRHLVPGYKSSSPGVGAYVVGADPARPKPALLYIHGGGFIAGSASSLIRPIQDIAVACGCVVVSPEYRLAPETRFPGPLDDVYATLLWLHGQAKRLGVDPTRIAVFGDSAGGGLAAMLSIAARDRGQVPLVFQALIYPMLDDRTGSTHSVPTFMGKYIWAAADNRFGWSALLGRPAGSTRVPAGSVPAREKNLAGLPPTFVGVGSIDLFANEDIDYARRLMDSAVSTELLVIPGGYHGFDIFTPQAKLSRQFTAAWQGALRRAFGS